MCRRSFLTAGFAHRRAAGRLSWPGRGQVNDVMKQLDRMWQIRDLGMTFSDFMREMELEVRARGAPRASSRACSYQALSDSQRL